MSDNILSQDEIDALLAGGLGEASGSGGGDYSNEDLNLIKDLFSGAVESISSVLSTIILKNVSIALSDISVKKPDEIKNLVEGLKIVVYSKFTQGLSGDYVAILSEEAAGNIATLMMGEEPHKPDEFTELYISGISEGFNQVLGSITKSLSEKFGTSVVTDIPQVKHTDFSDFKLPFMDDDKAIVITYRMQIEEVGDFDFYQVVPKDLADSLLTKLKPSAPAGQPAPAPEPSAGAGTAPAVQPVQFGSFEGAGQPAPTAPSNLDLLIDVPMQVTVELGRTKMQIKDILNLGPGSIIELDKLAGEPVDLLVNGKLIAKGEVVVIDENFGVRVTDIVSPMERINDVL